MSSPKPNQSHGLPPRWLHKLLVWFHPENTLEEVEGDLDELYAYWYKRAGKREASVRYLLNVLSVLPPFVRRRKRKNEHKHPSILQPTMIRNYVTIAFRNLMRHKLNSSLNLAGLAIGFAAGLLIILHVREELQYDKGFTKSNRIFRLNSENFGETTRRWAATSPVLALEMQRQLPGIKQVARFQRHPSGQILSYTESVTGDVKRFEEKKGFFADSTVVDVFDIAFVKGNPKTALVQPNTIVLTEATAKRYFGDQEPMGKLIQDDQTKRQLTVSGVIKAFPFPTHLNFDYLISMTTLYQLMDKQMLERRSWSGFYNYVVLDSPERRTVIEAALPEFTVRYYDPTGDHRKEILAGNKLHLQPIPDIHLHSRLEKEMGPNSDIMYVYIFSAAALFILLVAAVNFINMATAQAFNRMKEVGIRKALGARKAELINQFLGESFLLTLAASALALLLFWFSIPFYNTLAAKNLQFSELFTPTNVVTMLLLTGIISFLAGVYPAWFIANFDPVQSLKGKKITVSSVTFVRKSLIVFQFAVSVFMIFSTLIVYRQMQFFQAKNLGFNQEHLVAVKLYNQEMGEKARTLQSEWQKNSAISDIALISTLPGDRFSIEDVIPLQAPDNAMSIRHLWGDENLLKTLQAQIKEGRNFVKQAYNARPVFIVNEAAVKALKLADPVGKQLVVRGDTGQVVGVVKDFNFASLHSGIDPLIVVQNPRETNQFLLKIKGGKIAQTLESMKATLAQISPSSLFIYTFIDEKLALLYESEQRMSNVLKVFAILGILISCLGLFGLSTYAIQLRTKEIGIRKVVGANIAGIVFLLSKDFLGLVLLAIVLASPLAGWVMNRWLQNFAYHVSLEWWIFVLAGVLAIGISLLTVSYKTIKAALMNPVKTLRSE
ncbi:ABC transporter permease [Runella sp.]|uniref:ABC transporter permease n=1 Tax=Runella sp. TaxID=1960881 RepID=UPI003D0E053D